MRAKYFIKYISIAVVVLVLFAGVFLFAMTLVDYKPVAGETLSSLPDAAALPSDTIGIITWNIGYAGLGDDMDFFYEGGTKTRASKARTFANLDSIKSFLRSRSEDFILMQEIDLNSRRSYGIDELSEISDVLPAYVCFFGLNYNVAFVPLPLTNPTGRIESGIASFLRYAPCHSALYACPNLQPYPERIFLPDRRFMVLKFKLQNGKQLVIINTHNSAYDNDGKMRATENEFLKRFLIEEYENGNYVIAAGDWNQTPPDCDSHASTEYFKPVAIPHDLMPAGWQWISDGKPTNRFLDMPYIKNKTQETLLDFFLVSPNVRTVDAGRIDLEYRYSDHNPVAGKFILN
jgi:endonuclease/exonuclease/phosphatase family metal-dependent hydrolase